MSNQHKLHKYLAVLWLSITCLYIYNNITKNYLLSGSIALFGQVIPDLVIAIAAYYKSRERGDHNLIFKLISISFGFAFIADLNYNLALNIYLSEITLLNDLLFDIPFISFLLTQVYLWYTVFSSSYETSLLQKLNIINLPYFLAGLIIFCVFIFSENWKIEYHSTLGIINIFITILESICFVCAIFCLNILRTRWLRVYSVGVQVVLLSDMLIRYTAVNNFVIPSNPFEITWIFGLMIIISSLNYKESNDDSKKMNSKTNDLSTMISISIFSISIISISIFFLVNSIVSVLINDNLYIGAKYIPVSIVLFSIISSMLSVYISNYIQRTLDKIKDTINRIENEPVKEALYNKFNINEINEFISFMLSSFKHKAVAIEQEKKYSLASRQMAHDIRSPIFALNSLASNTASLPENEKMLIKNISRRINEIANSFLHYNYKDINKQKLKFSILPVTFIVQSLIEEKYIECKSKNIKLDYNISDDVITTFIESNEQELYRAISNIINNSIEASNKPHSTIQVSINTNNSCVIISIKDNGIGIPGDILPNLFKQNYSYSKSNGKGLGLYYANEVIKYHNGKIDVKSEVKKGTSIDITLNKTDSPLWFCEKINIPRDWDILILDDCKAVQNAWKKRFLNIGFKNKVFCFTTVSEFLNYIKNNDYSSTFFILDYELADKKINGIQLIARNKLQNKSILSTGHFTDKKVIMDCNFLKIKMIPKNYAHHIKIILEN